MKISGLWNGHDSSFCVLEDVNASNVCDPYQLLSSAAYSLFCPHQHLSSCDVHQDGDVHQNGVVWDNDHEIHDSESDAGECVYPLVYDEGGYEHEGVH